MIFGMDVFNYGSIINFDAENKTFEATQTIPSLKEIYENGHPYVKEFTIGSSATGVSFPTDNTIQITGHDGTYSTGSDYDSATGGQIQHYGTMMRFVAAEGYQVNVGGYVGDGYGKTIPSSDLPYKKSIHIIGPDGTKYMPTSSGNGDDPDPDPTYDPSDCAGKNRVKKEDDNCGVCLSGYYQEYESDLNCILKGTTSGAFEDEVEKINWLLWGGGGVVVVALIAAIV